jgi:hypothetical protein
MDERLTRLRGSRSGRYWVSTARSGGADFVSSSRERVGIDAVDSSGDATRPIRLGSLRAQRRNLRGDRLSRLSPERDRRADEKPLPGSPLSGPTLWCCACRARRLGRRAIRSLRAGIRTARAGTTKSCPRHSLPRGNRSRERALASMSRAQPSEPPRASPSACPRGLGTLLAFGVHMKARRYL